MRLGIKAAAPARRVISPLTWWFGTMALGGLAFGLVGDRRPFGPDVLAHPFAIFFLLVGAGLLLLRVVAARPVPDLIPDRALPFGCVIGLAGYLAGNFVTMHLLSIG